MPKKIPIATGYRPVTVGCLPANHGAVLTTVHASEQRIRGPRLWALISGIAGLAANVLIVLAFLLAEPFSGVQNRFAWLNTANDWAIIVQFATFIPVALALPRWLPKIRSVRLATVTAVGGMVAVVALQLLLVTGAIEFEVQVFLVVAAFLLVYAWVFTLSSIGHRYGTLPRSVTRFGLLLGAYFPLALLITASGLLFGWGSAAQLSWIAGPGWLALPVWPLVLARLVFRRPTSLNSKERGL